VQCRYVVSVQLQPHSSLLRGSRKQCFTVERQYQRYFSLHFHRNCCFARTQIDKKCPHAESLTDRYIGDRDKDPVTLKRTKEKAVSHCEGLEEWYYRKKWRNVVGRGRRRLCTSSKVRSIHLSLVTDALVSRFVSGLVSGLVARFVARLDPGGRPRAQGPNE
jgi:hypothetical protein